LEKDSKKAVHSEVWLRKKKETQLFEKRSKRRTKVPEAPDVWAGRQGRGCGYGAESPGKIAKQLGAGKREEMKEKKRGGENQKG